MKRSIMRVVMDFRFPCRGGWLLIALWFLSTQALPADIKVTIVPPPLVEVGSVLEDLVSQQEIHALVSEPLGVYEAEGRSQVVGALNKPGLYQGMAAAAPLPVLTAAQPLWDSPRFSLVLSAAAAVQTDTFDRAVLADRAQTLRPEADYRLGFAAQPLTLAASWTPLPGELAWSLGAFGAFSQVAYAPVSLTTFNLGASVHLRWAPRGVSWGPLSWEGITVATGLGRASNRYDTELSYEMPPQVVHLDLTYLDAGNIIISSTPRFHLTLVNEGTFWPLQFSTEASLGRTLRLGFGGGAVLSHGTSSMSIAGSNRIHIASENPDPSGQVYEKFLGNTGWFTVRGHLSGSVGPWWQPFFVVTPAWSVGTFRFGVPVAFRLPGGLSVALAWGITL